MLLLPQVKKWLSKLGSFYGLYPLATFPPGDFTVVHLENSDTTPLFDIGRIGPLEERDAEALEKVVQKVAREGVRVVEVGSWTGQSTSVLANIVAGYYGQVFAVDHWRGGEGTENYEWSKVYDIYTIFKRNMMLLGLWDTVHPLVMDSQTASQIFADGRLDLVFIDADHRYEFVKKDISYWLPKLREGGILCGHDCEGYYSEYPEEVKKLIEEHLNDDAISGIHPGVVKALYECFGQRFSIVDDSVVWYYIHDGKGKE